jgi:hypothetical protein
MMVALPPPSSTHAHNAFVHVAGLAYKHAPKLKLYWQEMVWAQALLEGMVYQVFL